MPAKNKLVLTETTLFCRQIICLQQEYSPQMRLFFKNPDKFIKNNTLSYLKNAKNDVTTIALVKISNKQIVIKRYNHKNSWRLLRNSMRQSKANKSWRNALYLRSLNIPVIQPIAILEKRFCFLKGKSYFLSEFHEAETLCDFFAKDKQPTKDWEIVISNLHKLITKLYSAKICHSDFCGKNILIKNNELILLDLEHIKIYKHHNNSFKKAHNKDLKTFLNYFNLHSWAKEQLEKKLLK